ncbi:hypothetical protein VR45_37965, partial [Streptomyces sp. NRRL S-495]
MSTAAAADHGATVLPSAAAYGRTDLNTVVDQWSHWTPDARDSSHAGWLYKGSNYFYCWTTGATCTGNGRTSAVRLKTDDDSGNRNVYVTDVYLDKWATPTTPRSCPAADRPPYPAAGGKLLPAAGRRP